MLAVEHPQTIQALDSLSSLKDIAKNSSIRPTREGGDFHITVSQPKAFNCGYIDIAAHDYQHPNWLDVSWTEVKLDIRYEHLNGQKGLHTVELDERPEFVEWFYDTAERQPSTDIIVSYKQYQEQLFQATLDLIDRHDPISIEKHDHRETIYLFDLKTHTRVELSRLTETDGRHSYFVRYSPYADKRVHMLFPPSENFCTNPEHGETGWARLFLAAEAKHNAAVPNQFSAELKKHREEFILEKKLWGEESVIGPQILENISEMTTQNKVRPSDIQKVNDGVKYDYQRTIELDIHEDSYLVNFEVRAALIRDQNGRWQPQAGIMLREIILNEEPIDLELLDMKPIHISSDLAAKIMRNTAKLRLRDKARIFMSWLPF